MSRGSEALIRHPGYDFSIAKLEDVLAADFVRSVVRIGNETLSEKSLDTARQYIAGLRDFCEFLGHPSAANSPVITDLRRGIAPLYSHGDWTFLLRDFARHLKAKHGARRVFKSSSAMNFWLKHLAGAGVCPAGLFLKPEMPVKQKPTQTLVHSSLTPSAKAGLAELSEAAAPSSGDSVCEEAKTLYSHIAVEFGSSNPSAENLPMLVQAVLEKRLSSLHAGLHETFLEALEKRKEGQLLVELGRDHARVIDLWLEMEPLSGKVFRPKLEKVRELDDEEFLAGILAWCMKYHEYPGLHPYEGRTNKVKLARIRNEIAKQRPELSLRADQYIEWIGASRDLLVSGYLLIMFETWANPSSIEKLDVDCLKDITEALSVFDWVKPRAAAILSVFDTTKNRSLLSLTKVVEEIKDATKHYRRFAIDADNNFLFIHAYASDATSKGRSRSASKFLVKPALSWFTMSAKKLMLRINGDRWSCTPSEMRASLMLLHALKYGIKGAQTKAQHLSGKTTQIYVDSLPIKIQKEKSIRDFLAWLEALVTVKIDDFAKKLGIDSEEYEERKKQVLNSCFGGIHCSDPLSGYQPGSVKGHPCTQIAMCMTCEKRRNLFVASEDNVFHLVMWRAALDRAFREGAVDTDDINWVLWNTFVDTMYKRLEGKSRHIGLLRDVESRMPDAESNPYHRVFFKSGVY